MQPYFYCMNCCEVTKKPECEKCGMKTQAVLKSQDGTLYLELGDVVSHEGGLKR